MADRRRIALVVDDEPDVRSMVAALLEQDGWDTLEARNGDEALALAAACYPDVIVMDVMMPGKNGFEVYKELRADHRTAHVPVVMLTAINEHELGMHHSAGSMARTLGVDEPCAFIDKPIDAAKLRSALEFIPGG